MVPPVFGAAKTHRTYSMNCPSSTNKKQFELKMYTFEKEMNCRQFLDLIISWWCACGCAKCRAPHYNLSFNRQWLTNWNFFLVNVWNLDEWQASCCFFFLNFNCFVCNSYQQNGNIEVKCLLVFFCLLLSLLWFQSFFFNLVFSLINSIFFWCCTLSESICVDNGEIHLTLGKIGVKWLWSV